MGLGLEDSGRWRAWGDMEGLGKGKKNDSKRQCSSKKISLIW